MTDISAFVPSLQERAEKTNELYLPKMDFGDNDMVQIWPSSSLGPRLEAKPSYFGLSLPTPAIEDCDPEMDIPVPSHSPLNYEFPPISLAQEAFEVAQERRDQEKEIFKHWAESRFSPLEQMRRPARPTPFMVDFDFTYSFWDIINVPLITLAPESGLPYDLYDDFTKEQKKRARCFSVHCYPSSFWHLVGRLIPVHQSMLKFFELNDQNRRLVKDLPESPSRSIMKGIQAAHHGLVTKLDSVMIGEWNRQLAYPDVEVSTQRMTVMFDNLEKAQRWLKSEVNSIHQLATKRARLVELLEIGRNFRAAHAANRQTTAFGAEFRIRMEREVQSLATAILVCTRKLRKVHKNFAGEFTRLYNHLTDNMSYTPAPGPLFDEEIHPIEMNPIFEGFAMDPAAENVDWMKSLVSDDSE
ncbi:hypothetical protein N7540_005000 [Penicillium herquei]|nr:hypothetical protein N7540_005000 [Penicillium herquei]